MVKRKVHLMYLVLPACLIREPISLGFRVPLTSSAWPWAALCTTSAKTSI